jgi:alkanesulfonate monooxygenase SsuD/methylene tetrahydromethanopterin reductase-like flavin-dependent oxidoreductase (luciferase family)
MGDPTMASIRPITGSPAQIADRLAAFAAAGAAHLQLVIDPITQVAIEWLGETLAVLDG